MNGDTDSPVESKQPHSRSRSRTKDSQGWDGKLRVTKNDLAGGGPTDEPSPPESENEAEDTSENPLVTHEGEQINADEDLLEGIEPDETEVDVNHCRITSIPALRLERFPQIERLCLRQNQVSHIKFPEGWGEHLQELDLYDNAISHPKGFEEFHAITSLDLSFNKIKHIKQVNHLKTLTDLYFVQNKIQKIEGLEGLDNVRNLELAANRIREIENLESLTSLEELWLGKNKITELKNLTPLINLRILSIQSNRLTSNSLSHLSTLPALEELYISHNALSDVTALGTCRNLRTIDVSANPITSIAGLKPCTLLEEVWASDCQLESFEEIEQELADKQHLTTVYFEGNPLQRRKRELYRNKVRLALPQVKQIDATFVRAD